VFCFECQNRTGKEHVWSFCGTDAPFKPGELQSLRVYPFSSTTSGDYNVLVGPRFVTCRVVRLLRTAEGFYLKTVDQMYEKSFIKTVLK